MSEFNHVVRKDGEVEPGKVERAIESMDTDKRDRILENFESFRSYLGRRIEMAESFGLGEEQMAMIAQKVADYLARREEPRNGEENLLRELWRVGTEEERHQLAHMLVKLAGSSSRDDRH